MSWSALWPRPAKRPGPDSAVAISRRSPGAETVTGDLNDPASLRPALDGAEGVFLCPGYADMAGVLAEARRAGVRTVVQLSGMSAGSGDLSNAITRYMAGSKQAVWKSGWPGRSCARRRSCPTPSSGYRNFAPETWCGPRSPACAPR